MTGGLHGNLKTNTSILGNKADSQARDVRLYSREKKLSH